MVNSGKLLYSIISINKIILPSNIAVTVDFSFSEVLTVYLLDKLVVSSTQ